MEKLDPFSAEVLDAAAALQENLNGYGIPLPAAGGLLTLDLGAEAESPAGLRCAEDDFERVIGGLRLLMRARGDDRALFAAGNRFSESFRYLCRLLPRHGEIETICYAPKPGEDSQACLSRKYGDVRPVSAQTCRAAFAAFYEEQHFHSRLFSIHAHGIAPKMIELPFGATAHDALKLAELENLSFAQLIAGTLLRGQAISGLDAPVPDEADALHLLTEKELSGDACIRCGTCLRVCPEHLPVWKMEARTDACTDCGACTYFCPTRHALHTQVSGTLPSAPFCHCGETVRQRMLAALPVPAALLLAGWYFHGSHVLLLFLCSLAATAAGEAFFSLLRRIPIRLDNLSFLMSACMLTLLLPPDCSWQAALCGGIATGFCKSIWGGLGHNWINPALFGAVLLRCTGLCSFLLQPLPSAITPEMLFIGTAQSGCIGAASPLLLTIGYLYYSVRKLSRPWLSLSWLAALSLLYLSLSRGRPQALLLLLCYGQLLPVALLCASDSVTTPILRRSALCLGLLGGCTLSMIRLHFALDGSLLVLLLANLLSRPLDALFLHIDTHRRARQSSVSSNVVP